MISKALFLVLEGKNNVGDFNEKYGMGKQSFNYENEIIHCVKAWRKYAGELADCNIYCVCLRSNPPSDETVLSLINDYGVVIINADLSDAVTLGSGYWNVPFAGEFLEKNCSIPEKILIHIDLDMILFKTPNSELFDINPNYLAKLSINDHRPTNQPGVKVNKIYDFEINTGFIVSRLADKFYSQWTNKIRSEFDNIIMSNNNTKTIMEE